MVRSSRSWKRLVIASLIAAAAMWAGSVNAQGMHFRPRLALLIGNNRYPGQPLPSCVNDVKGMAAWLADAGFSPNEIFAFTDLKKAETQDCFEKFIKIVEQLKPEQVVFFYSGHGTTQRDENNDEEDGVDEALVTVDAINPKDPAACRILDDELNEYFRRIAGNSDQLIVMIDSCFAGGAARGEQLGEEKFIVTQPGVVSVTKQPGNANLLELPKCKNGFLFLSASNQFQPARAGKLFSAFTGSFLKAVHAKEDRFHASGRSDLTLADLKSFLTNDLNDDAQTPTVFHDQLPTHGFAPGLFPDALNARTQEVLENVLRVLNELKPEDRLSGDAFHVTPSDGLQVRIGTTYAFDIETKQPGFLLLLGIQPNGSVKMFFPNRHRPLSLIPGDQVTAVPYKNALLASEPAGVEKYVFFLLIPASTEGIQDPLNLTAGVEDTLVIGPIASLATRFPGLRQVFPPDVVPGQNQRAVLRANDVQPQFAVAPMRFDGPARPATQRYKWQSMLVEITTVP